ncbi:MAG: hypothetical protein JHC33_01920 [Ignisphaera sp.]|nr:hypothetical protein [Ignisphaera sp.]
MKYIVIHIPTGNFLIGTGFNHKQGNVIAVFSKLGLVTPLKPNTVSNFRKAREIDFKSKGIQSAGKYTNYTDAQIEELFIRKPKKFKSHDDALVALRETERFIGIQQAQFVLTDENESLFDIMEIPDD